MADLPDLFFLSKGVFLKRHFDSGNGTIEFDEFVKMMASKTNSASMHAENDLNREAFHVFDPEDKGYIDAEGKVLLLRHFTKLVFVHCHISVTWTTR